MRTLLLFSIGLLAFTACKKKDKNDLDNIDCSTIASDYTNNIKPLVSSSCLGSGCHEAGSANGDFTTYAGLKAKADNGSLNKRLIEDKTMPPTGPLQTEQLKKVKCWLNSGAPSN